MPAKANPETQTRALLVRDAVATLGIEFPQPEDDRFRQALILRIQEDIADLEPGQLTRLHEAACKADAKHAGIPEFRSALRNALAKNYDLAGARKRARNPTSTPTT